MKFKIFTTVLLTLVLAIMAFAGNSLNAGWENLIKGDNLEGWVVKNGEHKYEQKDGVITGTSVLGQSNGFLCTKRNYGNFILELEFLSDDKMNSGIMIRALSKPEYNNSRVHGYQVEIDPASRAWTGGIYDEARRGWLYDLRNNEAARNAFKHGEWNTLHIEAIGNHIRTWLNGVPCANLYDDMTAEGFIGLQVHSSKESDYKMQWRNIRIIDLGTTTNYPAKIKGHTPGWQYK
jgi:hypothetical protein